MAHSGRLMTAGLARASLAIGGRAGDVLIAPSGVAVIGVFAYAIRVTAGTAPRPADPQALDSISAAGLRPDTSKATRQRQNGEARNFGLSKTWGGCPASAGGAVRPLRSVAEQLCEMRVQKQPIRVELAADVLEVLEPRIKRADPLGGEVSVGLTPMWAGLECLQLAVDGL
jgi:hypothetical protein